VSRSNCFSEAPLPEELADFLAAVVAWPRPVKSTFIPTSFYFFGEGFFFRVSKVSSQDDLSRALFRGGTLGDVLGNDLLIEESPVLFRRTLVNPRSVNEPTTAHCLPRDGPPFVTEEKVNLPSHPFSPGDLRGLLFYLKAAFLPP